MAMSRRYRDNAGQVDSSKVYDLQDAMSLLKTLRPTKFDETVEVVARLGVDPKKSDQMVRGAVSMPHGLGKDVRIVVFAEGDAAEAAKAAGATEVGSDELGAKIEAGWTDFDIVIAHPAMMRVVGKLGRTLGPQGKMPSPKSGTVTPDVAKATAEFKAGKVEFRVDSAGNVQVPVGKLSFSADKLEENARTFLDLVSSMRPSSARGTYFRTVSVSSTMSPGLKVNFS
ncbi:MAG: 50S ribosomal protein L1 [Planctomycetota bacterium]|nr:50S ribosomal protein L1 [Planctomycetota bacterium]